MLRYNAVLGFKDYEYPDEAVKEPLARLPVI